MPNTDTPDAGLRLETTAEERGIRAERADYHSIHANTFMSRLIRDHDTLLAALRSERVRGEESMRDRAAKVAEEHSPVLVGDTEDDDRIAIEDAEAIVSRVGEVIAAAIKALPTTDQETTHG